MTTSLADSPPPAERLATHLENVAEVSSWLANSAADVDRIPGDERARIVAGVRQLNEDAREDVDALYQQQLLLARIYQTIMNIPEAPTAEGSIVLHEITRLLEEATIASEDSQVAPGILDQSPTGGTEFLSWLKDIARTHPAFKHPYYSDFINRVSTADDLRTYVIQESVVDGRFDDFLAMMQVGSTGAAKLEIGGNFWDELGNGKPDEVHTYLFGKIYDVFSITQDEIESALTANDLVSGNLAVLLCRYRQFYPEAVGYLGMTEWLVPDRFVNVIRAWQRLNLPDVGITYHRLHVSIDSQHAAGWFHNIVVPAADSSAYMRRGIARGALWRLNSSGRVLDDRLAQVRRRRTAESF
jgi:hypothetical protein